MIDPPKYEIFPLGENALTICFGNTISRDINLIVTSLSRHIEAAQFHGFVECVPAYGSLTIFFEISKVKLKFRTALSAFQIVKSHVEIALQTLEIESSIDSPIIEVPVSFDKQYALDLGRVAEFAGLSENDVIDIFLSGTYQVYMLGFLPGFAYMGAVDPRIAIPRKESPRKTVAKGSIGIAGKQTGIYPLESPGGWQIIGHTEIDLFTPDLDSPTLFNPGDLVKFMRT